MRNYEIMFIVKSTMESDQIKASSEAMKKIIIDLCGGTGSWSKPYADRGGQYEVKVITLPQYDVFEIELNEENGTIILKNKVTKEMEAIKACEVYGILAAPTCTMFSFARTTGKTPVRFLYLFSLNGISTYRPYREQRERREPPAPSYPPPATRWSAP